MPNGVEVGAGSLAVGVAANTEWLEQQLDREIPEKARRGGEKAGRAFGEGLEGPVAQKGREAARLVLDRLGSEFQSRTQRAAKQLLAGLITPQQAEQAGDEAGQALQRGLQQALERVRGVPGFEAFRHQLLQGLKGPEFENFNRQIKAQMEGAGTEGGRSFGDALSRSAARGNLGERIVSGLRTELDQSLGRIREDLLRGILDPEEAERQARIAGQRFQQALLDELQRLRAAGRLTPEIAERLQRELRTAGEQAGRAFGTSVDRGARSGLESINRFVRGAWRAGIVGAVIIVGRAMVRTFQRVARQIRDALQRAGEIQAIQRAFEQLATARGLDPTDLLNRLQEAARGTASSFDLMRSANEAMQAGLPGTSEQLAEMLELSRRLGKSLGTDAEESYRRFITAVVRGRRQILDDIGVVVDFGAAHQALADRLGVTVESLTEEQKAAARLEGALEVARRRVDDLGDETFTASERLQQMETATRNVVDAVLLGIAESPRFTRVLETLANQALDTADALDLITINTGALVDTVITLLTDRRLAAAFATFAAGPAAFADAIRVLAGQEPIFTKAILRMAGVTGEFEEAQKDMRRAVEASQRTLDIRRARTPEQLAPIAEDIRRDVAEVNRLFEEGQIDREERQRRLLELQKQVNAIAARELQIKAGTLDVETEITEEGRKQAEQARARLQVLEVLAQEAERVGFPAPREVPEGPLRAAVERAAELRAEIQELSAEIESAARIGPVPAAALDELAAKQEELNAVREEALRVAETPEGRIGTEAVEAREKLDELLEAQRLLAEVGLMPADAPAELLALSEALGSNVQEMEALAEAAARLAPEDAALAEAAAARIRALEEENDRIRELIGTTAGLADAFREFPELDISIFEDLDPSQVEAVSAALERLLPLRRELNDALAEAEIAQARLGRELRKKDPEYRRLEAAQEAFDDALRDVVANLEEAGVVGRILAGVLEQIRRESEGADDAVSGLAKTLDTVRDRVQEVRSVASGLARGLEEMGVIGEGAASKIDAAFQAAAGAATLAKGIATGDPLSIAAGVADIVQGVAGLAGPTARAQELRALNEALRELARDADRAQRAIDRLDEEGLAEKLEQALAAAGDVFAEEVGGEGLEALRRAGADFKDIAAGMEEDAARALIEIVGGVQGLVEISQILGLELDDLIQFAETGQAKGDELNNELRALLRALDLLPDPTREATARLEEFIAQLRRISDLTQRFIEVGDIEGMEAALLRLQDAFSGLNRLADQTPFTAAFLELFRGTFEEQQLVGPLGEFRDAFFAALRTADIGTAAGRQALEDALFEIVRGIRALNLRPEVLEALEPLLELIGDVDAAIDDIQEIEADAGRELADGADRVAEAVRTLGDILRDTIGLLQREFEILDIEDPVERLRVALERLAGFAPALFGGADIETAGGRAALESAIEDAFRRARVGEVPQGLERDEFLDLLGTIEGLLDAVEEAAGPEGAEGETTEFGVFRGVRDITANRMMGALQTGNFLAQLRNRLLELILEAVGGRVPEVLEVQALDFGSTLRDFTAAVEAQDGDSDSPQLFEPPDRAQEIGLLTDIADSNRGLLDAVSGFPVLDPAAIASAFEGLPPQIVRLDPERVVAPTVEQNTTVTVEVVVSGTQVTVELPRAALESPDRTRRALSGLVSGALLDRALEEQITRRLQAAGFPDGVRPE